MGAFSSPPPTAAMMSRRDQTEWSRAPTLLLSRRAPVHAGAIDLVDSGRDAVAIAEMRHGEATRFKQLVVVNDNHPTRRHSVGYRFTRMSIVDSYKSPSARKTATGPIGAFGNVSENQPLRNFTFSPSTPNRSKFCCTGLKRRRQIFALRKVEPIISWVGLHVRSRQSLKAINGPHVSVGGAERGQRRGRKDGRATAPDATLHEVAWHVFGDDGFERRLHVIEPIEASHGVGNRRPIFPGPAGRGVETSQLDNAATETCRNPQSYIARPAFGMPSASRSRRFS